MQAKELIFRELLRRGYSQVGNHRVWSIADSKLWYITPQQAKAYLALEKSKSYKNSMIDAELTLIEHHSASIVSGLPFSEGVNIIDVGCGNGVKAIPIIRALAARLDVRYCPVDVSGYMISQAIAEISKLKTADVVQFKWNVSGFEHLESIAPLLVDRTFPHNLFLIFGNTLGNFEFHEVMYQVAEALRSHDSLLIGLPLRSPGSTPTFEHYQSRIQDDFLSLVLTQIGFKREDVEFKVEFNNSRYEGYYTVLCDATIAFGGTSLSFKKGDRILVGVSYYYTRDELENALGHYFKNIRFYPSSEGTSALVLCRK